MIKSFNLSEILFSPKQVQINSTASFKLTRDLLWFGGLVGSLIRPFHFFEKGAKAGAKKISRMF